MAAYTHAHHCSLLKTGAVKIKLCAYIRSNAWLQVVGYFSQSLQEKLGA